MIEGLIVNRLNIIGVDGGDVLHAMKSYDRGYDGFGEAYFSTIESGIIKGWKRHRDMVLNLVVPIGTVRFVTFDDRIESLTRGNFHEIILSRRNYSRLTVPPMVWTAFQGGEESVSMLLNIANIPHDPAEIDRKELDEIDFDWRVN
ncbi:dTDP-4-dehydrorhamnose 3,5-epimerase [Deltaproteobacteria bacterium]|nr:dTDP-4-dehydrorhamnose 3,5-epimerase [Deltaproteobacteria bacterium]